MVGKPTWAPETGICRPPHWPLVWWGDVMVANNCHNRDSWEELREPGEDKTGDLGDIFLPRRGGTSMCDVCPENKGDVGLQPCHGFKGGETGGLSQP